MKQTEWVRAGRGQKEEDRAGHCPLSRPSAPCLRAYYLTRAFFPKVSTEGLKPDGRGSSGVALQEQYVRMGMLVKGPGNHSSFFIKYWAF